MESQILVESRSSKFFKFEKFPEDGSRNLSRNIRKNPEDGITNLIRKP